MYFRDGRGHFRSLNVTGRRWLLRRGRLSVAHLLGWVSARSCLLRQSAVTTRLLPRAASAGPRTASDGIQGGINLPVDIAGGSIGVGLVLSTTQALEVLSVRVSRDIPFARRRDEASTTVRMIGDNVPPSVWPLEP